jgi:hypothetical protein
VLLPEGRLLWLLLLLLRVLTLLAAVPAVGNPAVAHQRQPDSRNNIENSVVTR